MTRPWFKPKSYGWGFVPITWEGWLATLALIAIILTMGQIDGIYNDPVPTMAAPRFIIDLLFITGVASWLFAKKMEEPLKWRWGKWRR
jgi:hypothetical protein